MGRDVKKVVRSGLLLGIAIVFQLVGKNIPQINQLIVGPIINAVLFMVVFYCGTWWGAAVGALTPVTAFILGQLNPVLGPFIPFIIIGNIILIACFGFLKGARPWVGILSGAVLKYFFLSVSSTKLIYLFNMNFPERVANMLAKAMGVTQLVTALIGGTVALVLIGLLNRRIEMEE